MNSPQRSSHCYLGQIGRRFQNRAELLLILRHFLPLLQAFLNVLDQCPKIELDVPLVKSYLAQFSARAIIAELVSVAELAHPLENGTHFPLFLLCLQQAAKLKDREWLTDLFQQSKVNMQKMLPGVSVLPDRRPLSINQSSCLVSRQKSFSVFDRPWQKSTRTRTECWRSWRGRAWASYSRCWSWRRSCWSR